jgi:hypothetical protein
MLLPCDSLRLVRLEGVYLTLKSQDGSGLNLPSVSSWSLWSHLQD